MEPLPVCPKSGLLRSRCRCSDPACWGSGKRKYRPRSTRSQRRRYRREAERVRANRKAQQEWIRGMWRTHAAQHPDMWSDQAKTNLFGAPRARDN